MPELKNVWLVMGETGEYDDYTSWVATVCGSKRTAESICRELNIVAKRLGRKPNRTETFCQLAKVGDMSPAMDYTGTTYEVEGPVRIVRSLAEAPQKVNY